MSIKKIFVGCTVIFLLTFSLGVGGAAAGAILPVHAQQTGPETQAVQPGPPGADEAIRAAFAQAAANEKQREDQTEPQSLILGYQIFETVIDNIVYSNDGSTALLWIGLRDPETGEVIETEPGLSIARNDTNRPPDDSTSWNILIPSSPAAYDSALRDLPEELLTEDVQQRFLQVDQQAQEMQLNAAGPFRGYKLPWTAGAAKRVTNSIGHVYSVSGGLTSCPSTCRFAYDFADGTMFPLLASKGGTVKSVKWACANFDTNCTNYLILEDKSTSPTSYQVYYHLANNSIPQRLRTIGAVVQQGEYIGDADDTGFSTGHHLHYHVYTAPNSANWTWGTSVEFLYDDVQENGGRPRTRAEAQAYPELGAQYRPNNLYVSGNRPANPPRASMELPADRQTVNERVLRVQGSAYDDLQITRILVAVNVDGAWKDIDEIPAGSGAFTKDVDLCAAGIPDGPFSLTLRIYDREGSQAAGIPVRQLIKNYACSTPSTQPVAPACTPNADQVALYQGTDFRGLCRKFDVNNNQGYTVDALGALGNDAAQSIQVGSNVKAILFDQSADVTASRPFGRSETFFANDAGLGDNVIGAKRVSGLWVVSRGAVPRDVFINPVGPMLVGNAPSSVDSIVFSWVGGGGAEVFDARLTGPSVDRSHSGQVPSWSVGSLAAGSYRLAVTARSAGGARAAELAFTVSSASLPAASARPLPYEELFQNGTGGWLTTGIWRYGEFKAGVPRTSTKVGNTIAWIYNKENPTNYIDANYQSGSLTSPPIQLPDSGTAFLRFAYFMETEDGTPYWDQRRVQISRNNGPFEDLMQLSEDKAGSDQLWRAATVSLQKYAGSTIRVRFHMETIDAYYNTGRGWVVDDVRVNTQAPNTSCADNGSTPDKALPLLMGVTVSASICPEGDLDYYSIQAVAGQTIVADVDAKSLSPASKLDALVQLIDADGRSIIAENDDEKPGVNQDSLLTYTIQRDGTYYLRVKAWNTPEVGGPEFFYRFTLRQDLAIAPREVFITSPTSGEFPSSLSFIEAQAVDFDGGLVAHVDFYWHGPDWNQGWVKLGSDTNGADGWAFLVDPLKYGGARGSAAYVRAVSRTGGTLGAVVWESGYDHLIFLPVITRE
jgi:hypothetical protein